jgi:hypothetical protein
MEIEVAEIPPLPEAVETYLPLVGTRGGEAGSVDVEILGSAPREDLVDIHLSERLDLFPEKTPSGPGSVFDPGSMWTVQDLLDRDDQVEVAVGRRGGRETSFLLPRHRIHGLEPGALLAAPSETLHTETNFFGMTKMLVEFKPDPGLPSEFDVWLPILRLHCPRHDGCEAEYATAVGVGDESKLELSLFGVGGGGGQSMTCIVSQSYSTKAECIEIVVPARLVLQMGATFANGTQVAYGTRVTIKDIQPSRLKEAVLSPGHGCGQPLQAVRESVLWEVDRIDGGQGISTWEKKIERETEGRLSLSPQLGNLPLKLGIDYVRKASFETTIKVILSTGVHYAAYEPEIGGEFEVLWTP